MNIELLDKIRWLVELLPEYNNSTEAFNIAVQYYNFDDVIKACQESEAVCCFVLSQINGTYKQDMFLEYVNKERSI